MIETTGHPTEVFKVLEKKAGVKLKTPSGVVEGKRPMCAELGEKLIIENTKECWLL